VASVIGGGVDNNWRRIGVKGASNIPLFFDSALFDSWPNPIDVPPPEDIERYIDTPFASEMCLPCINRHRGFINMAFLDMHIRKVGLKELWTLKWHRTYDTMGRYTKAGRMPPNEWPEWMRKFKDY